MRILVTKDASTKIPREVADLDEARNVAAMGFHVEVLNDDDSVSPLPPAEQPPVDDAHVAIGSTRFSDGQIQTDATLKAAVAPVAKKAPAKKAAPAKVAAKKTAKRR